MATQVAVLSMEEHGSPGPQTRTKPIRDSLRILDPACKKLSSLETQRIAGVLEDCIRKMEVVALLPSVLSNLDRLSVGLGTELVGALREHWCLGERLTAVLERRGEEGEENSQLASLELALGSSFRSILRLLRAHPSTYQTLKGQMGPSDGDQGLARCVAQRLSELQGLLFEKLLTSPGEEQERRRYIQEVSLRHRNNLEIISTLEKELAAAIQDRDTEINKKNEVIRKLKSSLHQMERISEDFLKRTRQEAEKQCKSDCNASESRRARMQQEMVQLHSQLNALIAENRTMELALRKRKYKVETEIENWIQKYDADMGEKQAELEELEAVFAEEAEELGELERRFTVLEQEHSQIVEERRVARERREEEERQLVLMTRAAVLIQAFWKGYKVRKLMKGKKKGKKGKKGKGKKGKK
ncbi:dynein regulatory complex protein 10 [Amia ocellicauda]|uniref:dynein regulatory complex protein 10 n=1 Tax=Amia ocellicauda TaxID=2972642 RepID=UPI003463C3FC